MITDDTLASVDVSEIPETSSKSFHHVLFVRRPSM